MRKSLCTFIVMVMAMVLSLPMNAQSAKIAKKAKAETTTTVSKADIIKAQAVDKAQLLKSSANTKKAEIRTKAKHNFAKGLKMRPTTMPNFNAPKKQVAPVPFLAGGSSSVFGSVLYSNNMDVDYGIYEMPTIPGAAALSPVAIGESFAANGGGVLVGDTYYCTNYLSFFGFVFVTTYAIDAETWEVKNELNGDIPMIATDVTYDPTTERIYGCFYNDEADGFVFGFVDYEAGVRVAISDIPDFGKYFVVAAAADGTIYAVNDAGTLLKVDKETGAETVVGETGVENAYTVSGTIDQRSGDMYMTASPADESGYLYKVDTTTGQATLLYELPGKEEICGLFIPTAKAEDGAPDVVKNLAVNFEGNSLTGNVSFTAPGYTYAGKKIIGSLDYTVKANGEVVATGTVRAGKAVEVEVTVPCAGNYEFVVYTTNKVGDGPKAKVSAYVGDDLPSAVQNFNVSYEGGKMNLSWDAVTTSINGGYINYDELTYNVVRTVNGESTVVAEGLKETSYSEAFAEPEDLTTITYAVTAVYAGEESVPAVCNPIVLGSILPPYSEDFENAVDLSAFTVIDANEDGIAWDIYASADGNVARVRYNSMEDMDDWLITAPIKMEKGKMYTVSFKAAAYSSMYPERVEAFIASSTDINDLKAGTVVAEPTDLTTTEWIEFSKVFIPKADGNYYLGIHGCSDVDQLYLLVDDIAVSEGVSATTPAAPEFSVVADPTGAAKATLNVTAPTKTAAGDALAAITKIEFTRDGDVIGEIASVTPGNEYSYVDETVEAGDHVYAAVAYNADGAGIKATANVHVGLDVPAAVENLTLVETAPGHVKVTWTAPTKDINGMPITCDNFIIMDSFYETYQIEGTEFECDAVAEGEQDFVYFFVAPVNEAGVGDAAVTEMIPAGEAYTFPYEESFNDGSLSTIFGINTPEWSNAEWGLYTNDDLGLDDADGTNGYVAMAGSAVGDQGDLLTGKISLVGSEKPVLSFCYYNIDLTNPNTLVVSVRAAGETEWTVLADFTQNGGTEDGEWVPVTLSLDQFKGKDIQVMFTPTTEYYKYNMIDAIQVKDARDNDLVAKAINAPSKVAADQVFNVNVAVANNGANEAEGYTVDLYRNGVKVQTAEGEALGFAGRTNVTFKEKLSAVDGTVKYYAVVNYDIDENADNNKTETVEVVVNVLAAPVVTDLIGAQVPGTDNVQFSWSAPELTDLPVSAVTEDFEGAESFAQTVEGWTIVDADGGPAGGIQGIDIPGVITGQSPLAWFVLDGSDDNFNESFASMSGNKHMSTMFNYDGSKNDDWMISPELSGQAQTISFYAKSFTASYGLETVEVLYSTTDKELSSFVSVGKLSVPDEWTEVTADLPEGAKYLAIRCVSQDVFMLFVDDVTMCTAAGPAMSLEIVGYNLYRDGVKVNDEVITETSYTDIDVPEGEHVYTVTVVYDKGESGASNEFVYENSDIAVGVDAAVAGKLSVKAADSKIIVSNAAGNEVNIFAADGKAIATCMGEAKTVIAVRPGIYVVEVGEKKVKVVVK